MKDELEVERARIRPASPEVFTDNSLPCFQVKPNASPSFQKPHISSLDNNTVSDEVEIEEVRTNGKAAAKPSSKRGATVKAGLSNKFADKEAEAPKQQVARKRTGGRKPVLFQPDSDIEEVPEPDEEEVVARRKRKGKAKASEQDAIEEDEPPAEKKGTRKRKATSDDEDQEAVEIIEPKAKKGARAASQSRNNVPAGASRGRRQPSRSRAGSRQRSAKPVAEEENGKDEEGPPAPKKKRRINLFPTNDEGAASVLAGVRLS
jgi:hypothetical protein